MEKIKNSRAAGFLTLALIYLFAAAIGIVLFAVLMLPLPAALLIADSAATVWVFLFSLIFKNASVYDPYWSVAPPVILTALAIARGVTFSGTLILAAVWIWGIRLTANWAYTFHGLRYEDWRYVMLREKTGKLYPLVNFFGIHYFPTLVVFLCVLPAAFVIDRGAAAPNAVTFIGFALCLCAAALQFVSDWQMHAFRKKKQGGLIREGLWKYARHPNYLGEILMWWGAAILSLSLLPLPQYLFGAAGALVNTLMFLLISIPMADKRQARKEGYAAYKEETRSLLPLPKLKKNGKNRKSEKEKKDVQSS